MSEEETTETSDTQPKRPSAKDVVKAALSVPAKGVAKVQEGIAKTILGAQDKLAKVQEEAAEKAAMKAEAKAEAKVQKEFKHAFDLKGYIESTDAKIAELEAQLVLHAKYFETILFRLKKKGIEIEMPKPPEPVVEEVPVEEELTE